MKILTASLALAVLSGGSKISTEYKPDTALRVEVASTMKMETTTMQAERDGEPVEMPGGGASSESERKEVHVDKVVEAEKGLPTKVRRTFEEVGGTSSATFGDNTRESEISSPLQGLELVIARNAEHAIEIEVAEGSKPDDEKALEGHVPELFLDGLLPADDVEADATWDLDKDTIRRALRLDVERALYAPPQRPEGSESGGGGGGGRRGGMRGGGGESGLMQIAEWKGKAKLVATAKDVDGKTCAVIEIEIEASGDLPEPEPRAGGPRRRDDMPAGAPEAATAAKNTYEIKLEGSLVFDTKARRPVSLDLEGSMKTDSDRETKRGESTFRTRLVREGTVTFKVAVSEASEKSK